MESNKRYTSKWVVQPLCNINWTAWEISVIREDYLFGQRSWGWFINDAKIPISDSGSMTFDTAPLKLWMRRTILRAAQDIADRLNEKDKENTQ